MRLQSLHLRSRAATLAYCMGFAPNGVFEGIHGVDGAFMGFRSSKLSNHCVFSRRNLICRSLQSLVSLYFMFVVHALFIQCAFVIFDLCYDEV